MLSLQFSRISDFKIHVFADSFIWISLILVQATQKSENHA